MAPSTRTHSRYRKNVKKKGARMPHTPATAVSIRSQRSRVCTRDSRIADDADEQGRSAPAEKVADLGDRVHDRVRNPGRDGRATFGHRHVDSGADEPPDHTRGGGTDAQAPCQVAERTQLASNPHDERKDGQGAEAAEVRGGEGDRKVPGVDEASDDPGFVVAPGSSDQRVGDERRHAVDQQCGSGCASVDHLVLLWWGGR
jgi:hypothetical protein